MSQESKEHNRHTHNKQHQKPKTPGVTTKPSSERIHEHPGILVNRRINWIRVRKAAIWVLGVVAGATITYFFQDNLTLLAISLVGDLLIVIAALLISGKKPFDTKTTQGS